MFTFFSLQTGGTDSHLLSVGPLDHAPRMKAPYASMMSRKIGAGGGYRLISRLLDFCTTDLYFNGLRRASLTLIRFFCRRPLSPRSVIAYNVYSCPRTQVVVFVWTHFTLMARFRRDVICGARTVEALRMLG